MHVADKSVTEFNPDSEAMVRMEKILRNNIPLEIQHLIKVETLIAVGTTADVIFKVARDKKPDLIIMGIHGLTGFTPKI